MRRLTAISILTICAPLVAQVSNLGNADNVGIQTMGAGVPTAACTVGSRYFRTDSAVAQVKPFKPSGLTVVVN